MAKGVVWDGLSEYLEELRKLPDECAGEAEKLIEAGVNGAYVTVSQFYGAHRWTGTLQARLTIKSKRQGARLVGLELQSNSPLAWLFDHGSKARHWKRNGKYVGEMPAFHIFDRTVGRARRNLAFEYRALLLRHGAASVIDDAA